MNSPGCRAVWPGPLKNSPAGTTPARRWVRRAQTLPSSTSAAGLVSAQGEALHRLPPSVARLRIWYEATVLGCLGQQRIVRAHVRMAGQLVHGHRRSRRSVRLRRRIAISRIPGKMLDVHQRPAAGACRPAWLGTGRCRPSAAARRPHVLASRPTAWSGDVRTDVFKTGKARSREHMFTSSLRCLVAKNRLHMLPDKVQVAIQIVVGVHFDQPDLVRNGWLA